MKKIIAVLLVAMLVVGGLGSVAYAQDEHDVLVESQASWTYSSPEDSFTNSQVNGNGLWGARIQNRLYATGETLASANLTLASNLKFDSVYPEPVTMGPPTYEWSFGEIPVGGGEGATVSFVSSDPSPIPFIPGFDASRSVYKTVFDAPGTQTITITVTPREAIDMFAMNVNANEDERVNPVITSCKLEDGNGGDKFTFNLSPDGHQLHMWQDDPVVDTKYTYTVAIEVTPEVDKVEFKPFVTVLNLPKYSITPGGTGSSVTYAADGMGTWTWSTGGNYPWAIATGEPFRGVNWEPSSIDLTNYVEAHFATNLNYGGPMQDTFTNGDEIFWFWKDWHAKMGNSPDGTEADVTALTLRLDSEVPFNTVRNLEKLTRWGPPTYEWSFGDVPQGSDGEQAQGAVQLMVEAYQPWGPEPPITFTPGFDASRSVDKAEFFFSDGPQQTQVLTVTLTPREQERTEGLDIHLGFDEHPLVEAVITSWTGGEGDIKLEEDGKLSIRPTGLEIDTTWSIDVTFLVTPKVPKVYFIPYIEVGWPETITSGTTSGNSISYPAGNDPAEEPGTWTWSAEGSYRWNWVQELRRAVHWFPRCREIVEPTPQELKGLAIEELEALTPTVSEQIGKEVKKAIGCLNKSLDLALWVDEYHLVLDKGKEVFNHEKDAVKHLTAARKVALKVENVAADELLRVIDRIVEADRLLAETAVGEATDPDAVAKAQKLVQEAQAARDAGKYEDAVDRYRKAWEATT